MISDAATMISLLLAVFNTTGALTRFVRYLYGEHVSGRLARDGSLTELAESTVKQLVNQGLIDNKLFDELASNRPDRKDVVEQVRHEILGASAISNQESPEPAATQPSEKVSDERLAWRERLRSRIAQAVVEPAEPPHPYIEAAAVLESFDPLLLRPARENNDRPKDLLERFAVVCDTLPDGSLSLKLDRRQETLATLVREHSLEEALSANEGIRSPCRDLLGRAWREWIPVHELILGNELETANQISLWLAKTEWRPFDLDQITVLLERRRRIAPLRRLVGTHFRDRIEQLEELHAHLNGDRPARILFLSGIGGTGKSALLGKLLLDLEQNAGVSFPWVYLDFDHPDIDPLRPKAIVETILRQLGEHFAGVNAAQDFIGLESVVAGDAGTFHVEVGGDADEPEILKAAGRAIENQIHPPRLAVVLDTFEQAQVRGEHAVDLVRTTIKEIDTAMPYARVIVSGRAPVTTWPDASQVVLNELDQESANDVLDALGVNDRATREKVSSRLRNPLSLRLAADAIMAEKLTSESVESMLAEVHRTEFEGQLYTRNLLHLKDREVSRLAHPGLVVRRVTVGVIRDVLATICDISPDRIAALFQRLPNHVTLFEPDESSPEEGSALKHRQDLREVMLRLMMDDPDWKDRIPRIHLDAINFYRDRTDPIGRAEFIYHHLMRDEEPELFESRWSNDLAQSLGRCWNEPLPDRARAWLGPRIGRSQGKYDDWRAEDWEVVAEREALARLETGDAAGALEVVQQRKERAPNSRLPRIAIEALVRLERWKEANDQLAPALDHSAQAWNPSEIFELHLLGAQITREMKDWTGFDRHIEGAMAVPSNGSLARVRVLLEQLRGDRLRDSGTEARTASALERSFLEVETAVLRLNEDLARTVLRELGSYSLPVLRKSAEVFGNQSSQELIRRDAFQVAGLLRHVEVTVVGKIRLSELAGEVGLPRTRYSADDLARQMVRYGKLGDALLTVIDYAGQDSTVRTGVAKLFQM